MAREPEEAAAAQGQLQCCICCFWGQLGILALSPGSIHPLCSCPRPASTSDLRLVEADGVSAPDCTQQGQPSLQHFVSLGQTGPKRLPLIATPRHLWLPNAIAREPEAAMAAQGQLQCRICCCWGPMGIRAPIPGSIHPVCSCPRPASTSDLRLVEADGILRLPWLANLRQRRLPRASFNVGSAATGGRWGFWPPSPAASTRSAAAQAGFNVGPDRTQQDQPSLEHFVSLGQTGSERLPWPATLRHRWLPRASFNVVSAASGGRWGFCGCHCSRT